LFDSQVPDPHNTIACEPDMKIELPIPPALLAAILSVALTLAACGVNEDSAKFTQRVYGEANLGTPLVGARIESIKK
jgi:hypothetical protein